MLDFGTPVIDAPQRQVFYGQRGVAAGTQDPQWHEYVVPRGATYLYILAVGGGGGGGGGFIAAQSTNRGGGGGGHSGALAALAVAAALLPSVLYVCPGRSGLGGAGGNPAIVGLRGWGSIVAIAPALAVSQYLVSTESAQGSAMTAASATSAGSGSTPGTAPTTANQLLAPLGILRLATGANGISGGTHTGDVGGSQSFPVSGGYIFTAGAGGGGVGSNNTNFAGGAVTASQSVDFAAVPGGVVPGGRGGNGNFQWHPLRGTGGGGGAAYSNNVPGNGGNGAWCCGGGGGGAGFTVGGGNGGDGGPGIVMITAW